MANKPIGSENEEASLEEDVSIGRKPDSWIPIETSVATNGLKFHYVSAHVLKELSLTVEDPDKIIIRDTEKQITALVTVSPDSHLAEADLSSALSMHVMRSLIGKPLQRAFAEQIALDIEELRAARKSRFGNRAAFLVVKAEGAIAPSSDGEAYEAPDFVFTNAKLNKRSISKSLAAAVTAALNAVASHLCVVQKEAIKAITFVRGDGKHVFSIDGIAFGADVEILRPFDKAKAEKVQLAYGLFSVDADFTRVQSLLRASFEAGTDSFRSFLFSWTALEIFVHKAFSRYEQSFFASVLGDKSSEAQRSYLARIREVMKDKYRVADKFAAIAFQISPDRADSDLKTFKAIKKLRDEMAHGQAIVENELPVKDAQNLAIDYLLFHLQKAVSSN